MEGVSTTDYQPSDLLANFKASFDPNNNSDPDNNSNVEVKVLDAKKVSFLIPPILEYKTNLALTFICFLKEPVTCCKTRIP